MKTSNALRGLLSGLLLLAAGTAQTHAGLLAPTGPGSQLYVANRTIGTIQKITPGGVGSVFATSSSGLQIPYGLAFDSAGNLFVANFHDVGSFIMKFTPGGVGSVFASSGLNGARVPAFDSAVNLYVASPRNNRIMKFSPTGSDLGVFADSADGLNHPSGLAFDSAGNLYAANAVGNSIIKFTPGGVGSVFANTGLNGPASLAFDSRGNLYAANYYSSTIQKYPPPPAASGQSSRTLA